MAHWFGIMPWDADQLTIGEIRMFLDRLSKAPPIGAVFMVSPEE